MSEQSLEIKLVANNDNKKLFWIFLNLLFVEDYASGGNSLQLNKLKGLLDPWS
jgi:hypothetical protein